MSWISLPGDLNTCVSCLSRTGSFSSNLDPLPKFLLDHHLLEISLRRKAAHGSPKESCFSMFSENCFRSVEWYGRQTSGWDQKFGPVGLPPRLCGVPSAFRGWGTGGGETASQTAWLSRLTWVRLACLLSLPLVSLPPCFLRPPFFVSFKSLQVKPHDLFL